MVKPFVLSAVLILIACGGSEPALTEETAGSGTEIQLIKVDSIGVELGEPEYTFGAIEGAVSGPDGNIAVLDRAACCIRVYTPEGEFLRQISREGNGPGELVSNAYLAITENGTLLTTGDGGEILGLHAFDYRSGEWLGSYPSMGTPPTCLTGCSGNTFMCKQLTLDTSTGEPEIVVTITLNGVGEEEDLVVFMEDRYPFNPQDMAELVSLVWYGYDLATDGGNRFYVAPRSTEEAEIHAFDGHGNRLFTITPEILPVMRTEEEMEIERYLLQGKAAAMGDGIPIVNVSPYKPLIRGIEVDRDGNLWALMGGPTQPEFMVFSPEGDHIGNSRLAGEQPDGSSWIVRFSGDNILAWAEEPAEGYQKLYTLEIQ